MRDNSTLKYVTKLACRIICLWVEGICFLREMIEVSAICDIFNIGDVDFDHFIIKIICYNNNKDIFL